MEKLDATRLTILHHDPDHNDTFIDAFVPDAKRTRPGTLVAKDGMAHAL
ncbi:MAG: hypothetical protein ING29_00860 [Azospirillum sp.]|nr:hypothetical protein [Azospirillum sp.]